MVISGFFKLFKKCLHWPDLHFKGVIKPRVQVLIVKSAFSNPFSVYYLWLLKHCSVYNVCDDVKYYLVVIGKSFCSFFSSNKRTLWYCTIIIV